MPAAAAVGALAEIVATAGLAAGLAVGLGRAQADTTARPPRWRRTTRRRGSGKIRAACAGSVDGSTQDQRSCPSGSATARAGAPAHLVNRHPVDGLREP